MQLEFFGSDVIRENTAAILDVTKLCEENKKIWTKEMHTRQKCSLEQVQKKQLDKSVETCVITSSQYYLILRYY